MQKNQARQAHIIGEMIGFTVLPRYGFCFLGCQTGKYNYTIWIFLKWAFFKVEQMRRTHDQNSNF
jgi:hypothetical protein